MALPFNFEATRGVACQAFQLKTFKLKVPEWKLLRRNLENLKSSLGIDSSQSLGQVRSQEILS